MKVLAKSSGYFAQHLVCNRPFTTMIPVRIRKHQFHWRSPALFFFFFHSNNITNFIVLFIYLLRCTKTIIWNFIKGKLHVLIRLCLFIMVFMSSDITCKYMYMFPVANLWAHFFDELWSKSRKIWKTESWAGPAYEARSYCKGTCFPLTELT